MRLICPNCEAEYEVDDAAIPDMGRDVQCSNCGHAWFQLPPEIELALEQEDELFGNSATPDPVDDPLPDSLAAALRDDEDEDDLPAPPPAANAPKRTVDENLMAVLREEAEREANARKAEASPIETQTEMGLAAPAAAAAAAVAASAAASAAVTGTASGAAAAAPGAGGLAAAARRIAQMKGLDPDAPPPAPPRPAARRDLLPDIEEINSSLKGTDTPTTTMDDDLTPATSNARGFRSGFAVAMLIAVLALVAYVGAPRIVAMVPALEGAVNAYVAGVDALRLWLDGMMRSATDAVRQMSATDN